MTDRRKVGNPYIFVGHRGEAREYCNLNYVTGPIIVPCLRFRAVSLMRQQGVGTGLYARAACVSFG